MAGCWENSTTSEARNDFGTFAMQLLHNVPGFPTQSLVGANDGRRRCQGTAGDPTFGLYDRIRGRSRRHRVGEILAVARYSFSRTNKALSEGRRGKDSR